MAKRETIPAPPPEADALASGEAAALVTDSGVELQLSIGREGVGVELAKPAPVGPVVVTELAATIPGARFPLDVSGGVARFRHRRGVLERLTIEVRAADLAERLAPEWRGLLSANSPKVRVSVRPYGASIGIFEDEDPERPMDHPRRVLAFDVAAYVRDGDVVLAVRRARGMFLAEPPTSLAIRAIESALGHLGEREGARFVVKALPGAVARELLPSAGARAPDAHEMAWAAVTAASDVWIMHAIAGRPSAVPVHAEAVRANEAVLLLREADDALVKRDWDRARRLALEVLVRAPSHPEACARIAEIDAHAGGRAEAAISTLQSAAGNEPHLKLAAGILLAEIGDVSNARAALVHAAEGDDMPEIASAAYQRAAALTVDPHESLEWLDRALARDPAGAHARWTRAAQRLAAGRTSEALADVEHLEALARGITAKHAVWRTAGSVWSDAGLGRSARALFERALRYAPDEPEALLGLGLALTESPDIETHFANRGIALIARALEILEGMREPDEGVLARARIALARAMVAHAGDRPAAVARVRDVPTLEARGLEGRWRADLGDLVGASLAYARLREQAEALSPPDASVVPMLCEAGAFEKERNNLAAAQAHFAAALRIAPRDPKVQAEYRALGARIAERERPRRPDTAPGMPALTPEDIEAKAEALERQFRADPSNDAIADQLANAFEELGKGHELVALILARIEDAPADRKAAITRAAKDRFARLERECERNGDKTKAELFRDARSGLGA